MSARKFSSSISIAAHKSLAGVGDKRRCQAIQKKATISLLSELQNSPPEHRLPVAYRARYPALCAH
jgi:hypothetical protein